MRRSVILLLLSACAHAPPTAPESGAPATGPEAPAPTATPPTAAGSEVGPSTSAEQAPAPSHAGHDHAEHAQAGPVISLEGLPEGALLLPGLGAHARKVSTRSPEAQRYFDQGLRLIYAFNHDEAARSFAKAAALDPGCASCFWGASLALGPNYNVPMLPDRAKAAWDALLEARAAAAGASPVEVALIDALATRYGGPEPVSPAAMQPFNVAYADAMRKVARQFPADDDVQVLFAEALMNLNPWKLWSLDGEPAPGTEEIVSTLETVLARSPAHPGANHYYIHAIEASPRPGKAEAAADRLRTLMPGAGHLVHMPAHIYQRVGRYADASRQNAQAAAVDEAYITRARPFGYYPVYLVHNFGFLAFSASMEGRQAEAVRAARISAQKLPQDLVCAMPGMDFLAATPYMVAVRFGRWSELLAEPRPDAKYQVQLGLWLHGHGMALASTGRADEARSVLMELEALRDAVSPDLTADVTAAKDLLAVAAQVLRARIAEKSETPEAALPLWEKAVAMSDRLPYSEPADWFYPVRHFHGAALLAAGRAPEAEAVYREDLRRNPRNGWALFGLSRALRAQKKDARQVEAEFRRAWKASDIQLTASAF